MMRGRSETMAGPEELLWGQVIKISRLAISTTEFRPLDESRLYFCSASSRRIIQWMKNRAVLNGL